MEAKIPQYALMYEMLGFHCTRMFAATIITRIAAITMEFTNQVVPKNSAIRLMI